jgi:hypothetical protein
MLSHLGWTCIEAGELDEGMAHTERSLALRRANGNIAHIVMHGLFERDDAATGLAFIDAWLPDYPEDAMLWGHLQWHAALTELALGRVDAALARFTTQVLRRLDVAPPLLRHERCGVDAVAVAPARPRWPALVGSSGVRRAALPQRRQRVRRIAPGDAGRRAR